MPDIRLVSDLRNNFTDISRKVHETSEPIFLTKNGRGDMVVMSMEAYQRLQFDSEVYFKLKEAEMEAKYTTERFTHEQVFSEMKRKLQEKVSQDV